VARWQLAQLGLGASAIARRSGSAACTESTAARTRWATPPLTNEARRMAAAALVAADIAALLGL
jgi:hypothetical protein